MLNLSLFLLFIIYLHTKNKNNDFTAIWMHVLVQLILYVWRNDRLTEWMDEKYFFYCYCYTSSLTFRSKYYLRKIPALSVVFFFFKFHCVFVNVKTLHRGYVHLLIETTDIQNKKFTYTIEFAVKWKYAFSSTLILRYFFHFEKYSKGF